MAKVFRGAANGFAVPRTTGVVVGVFKKEMQASAIRRGRRKIPRWLLWRRNLFWCCCVVNRTCNRCNLLDLLNRVRFKLFSPITCRFPKIRPQST